MKNRIALVAAGAIAALAGSANAAAFLTYLDPAGAREVKYTAPGVGEQFGTLVTTATVNLQIDLTDDLGPGSVVTFTGVTYSKTAKVSAASMAGSAFTAEVYDAVFTYTIGADTILTGSFGTGADDDTGGDLFINGLSGTISSNSDAVGGSLVYNFGSANIQAGNPGAGGTLQALLASAGKAFGDAIDANWTLTGITPRPALLQNGNLLFLQSFDANAAFSGTVAIVPTPGTAALAACGMVVGLVRRRKA